jgi:1,4-alpha-glucan branching enzyme
MSSQVERFIGGTSEDSYLYFGAFIVSDGTTFRIYAPHAKEVEVVVKSNPYKMEKVDFRGIFETRVLGCKEFDDYYFKVLTQDDIWIRKDDPYAKYVHDKNIVVVENDDYAFDDEKWMKKAKNDNVFNACLIDDEFNIDEQRYFVEYLKEYNYNYVVLTPYTFKHMFMVNQTFINESSLKHFINNLHAANIGVMFKFDTECFCDYEYGLNDLDGASIYNLEEDKIKEAGKMYFDYSKNSAKSYMTSVINYYLNVFHGDGVCLNDSEFNKELASGLKDKLVIYTSSKNNSNCLSSEYLYKIIDNINGKFDHAKFVNYYKEIEKNSYLYFDYDECVDKVDGTVTYKNKIAKILLTLTYISNHNCVTKYCKKEEYLYCLKALGDIYASSKSLHNSNTMEVLYNGKKANYFAYQFSHRNEYVIMLINFSDLEDNKFDLGMPYYGYYRLLLDTCSDTKDEELYMTRNKKIHGKTLAMQMHVKPSQALVYKRMRDI